MGGRWLATKISVKHVTLGGAVLFLIFGIAYLYEVRLRRCQPTFLNPTRKVTDIAIPVRRHTRGVKKQKRVPDTD